MLNLLIHPRADASLGLIQRQARTDNARLNQVHQAYYKIVAELRQGDSSIWDLKSDFIAGASMLLVPPLKVHFRWIHDDKIAILYFQEVSVLP